MTQDELAHNLPIYSVGEVSQALKRVVEDQFARVRVRGEISGFKRAASGHLYMALKDSDAVIDGVCWRGVASRLSIAPEDGMEVVASGRLTTYPGRSKYQIVIDSLELAGEGALLKLLEDRRKKLAAEGLFAEDRKQALPFLPRVIGVVTSPTGAVIRDILHRLADRFPRHVLIWPVLVQGDGAAEQVAAAINGFNRLAPEGPVPRPDLLIVARGGGSLEDLWAFNEEVVVRAAAASDIPLISAVGHETDTTLIDYAADRRAPTPTAAAEMAVPVRRDLYAQVLEDAARLESAANRYLAERQLRIEGLARGLPHPARLLEERVQRLDDRAERLSLATQGVIQAKTARVSAARPLPPLALAEKAADKLTSRAQRLQLAVQSQVQAQQARVSAARLIAPTTLVSQGAARLAAASRAMHMAAQNAVSRAELRIDQAGKLLEAGSYQRLLDKGFVLVTDAEGALVTEGRGLATGTALTLGFKDGPVPVAVTGAPGKAPAKPKAKAAPNSAKGDERQGSLL
ncbi:MAG: exodeoxyribonuclease VII large subunit [Magnetospiraceae bacterium]